nr:hypothetical protein [Rhizobium laguerreae]
MFLGPKAPPGKDSNWIPTDPKGRLRGDAPLLKILECHG